MKKGKNKDQLDIIDPICVDCNGADVSFDDADSDELPFESIDDFSTLPISFEENKAAMLTRAAELFEMSAKYNRHSSQYLKTVTLLDKIVRSLGSACITRFVVEMSGSTLLTKLAGLSTANLYRWTSFNFRKVNAALEEEKQKTGILPLPLMNALSNLDQTLAKLRATEAKLLRMNAGQIKIGDQYDQAWAFSERFKNRRYDRQQGSEAACSLPTAFPMDSAAVRELTSYPSEESVSAATDPSDPETETNTGSYPGGLTREDYILKRYAEEIASGQIRADEPVLPLELPENDLVFITVEKARTLIRNEELCTEFPELKEEFEQFLAKWDTG